jgi:subtilisin family serine protease
MKKTISLVILIVCLCSTGLAQQNMRIGLLERKNDSIFIVENGKRHIANKNVVTVKLKSKINKFRNDLKTIRSNQLGYIDIAVPQGMDVESYVSLLDNTGEFDIVEYNSVGEYYAVTNDTHRSNQWYLNSINMFSAWDISMGNSNIIVAIIDSGTDWSHSDIGNGNDGYKNINELAGWNYISDNENVITNNGHGTRVAGIVGAKSNNSHGISGISGGNNSYGVTMIPICVGVSAPDASVLDDAIIYAVDNGARIIQLSLGVGQTTAINTAIAYAVQNNVVIVCASGNGSSSTVNYPASHQNVIAVGAINQNNSRANFSNYGVNLDVVALGTNIFSTTLNDNYNSDDGTSFAAPQVSGIAALILSVRPDLTQAQVRQAIESTCTKINPTLYPYSYNYYSHPNGTWNNQVGHGLVNAYAALNELYSNFRIAGPTHFCSNGNFSIQNDYNSSLPNNFSAEWTVTRTREPFGWEMQCSECKYTFVQTYTTPSITLVTNNDMPEYIQLSAVIRNQSGTIISTSNHTATSGTLSPYVGTLSWSKTNGTSSQYGETTYQSYGNTLYLHPGESINLGLSYTDLAGNYPVSDTFVGYVYINGIDDSNINYDGDINFSVPNNHNYRKFSGNQSKKHLWNRLSLVLDSG